jgi:hypothetical protein
LIEYVIAGVVSTLNGSSILALFFFWLREKVFGIPDITGKWHFDMETVNTEYNLQMT